MARYDGAGSAVAPGVAGPNGAVLGTVWSIPTAVVAPVVVGPNGRRYYARTSEALLAIDPATERVSWRLVAPAAAGVGAAVDGPLAVTATADGALVGLAAATGERRWTAELDGTPTAPPVLTADAVALGTTEGLALRARADGRRCLALDTPGPVTAAVVAAGRVHAAVDRAPDGGLVAVDPRRGTVVAERFLPGRPRALAAADGRLLVATTDRLLALDATTGATRWTRDRTGPIAAGDAVYVADGATDRLVALDPATGETRWSEPTAGIDDVVATEEVVVATGGPAAAIGLHDPRTGWRRLRQRAATGYRRPSVADDRLFVVADDRTLALAAEPG
jgi:outer membrane protein assembly factor BamB